MDLSIVLWTFTRGYPLIIEQCWFSGDFPYICQRKLCRSIWAAFKNAMISDLRLIYMNTAHVNLHELSGSGRYACTRFIWNVPRKQLPEYVISGPSGVATSPFKCRQAAARFNGANHETREMTGSKKLNCQPKSKWHSNGFFPPGMFSNHIFPGSWIMFTLGNLSRNSFLFLKHDPFKSTGTSSQIISFSNENYLIQSNSLAINKKQPNQTKWV